MLCLRNTLSTNSPGGAKPLVAHGLLRPELSEKSHWHKERKCFSSLGKIILKLFPLLYVHVYYNLWCHDQTRSVNVSSNQFALPHPIHFVPTPYTWDVTLFCTAQNRCKHTRRVRKWIVAS